MSFLSPTEALESVLPHKREWKELPPKQKLQLIQKCQTNLIQYKNDYANAALQRRHYNLNETKNHSKSVAFSTESAMIQTMTNLHLALWLSGLQHTYSHISKTGQFPKPNKIEKNTNGTYRVTLSCGDFMMFSAGGMSQIEVHVDRQIDHHKVNELKNASIMEAVTGRPYDEVEQLEIENHQNDAIDTLRSIGGGVAIVLGAGNFDAPVDLLTALFVENNVVVYKFSPLSEQLCDPFTKIFEPLLQGGYLSFTRGGAKDAEMLLNHPHVVKWFMTGSLQTANQILFGNPESPFQDRIPGSISKEEMEAKLKIKKPFTIELGNCSPWIVVPGKWSNAELYRQARHLCWGLLFNGGHICVHPQVVITCKNWPQRDQFLKYIKEILQKVQTLGYFYPTANQTHNQFLKLLEEEGIDLEKAMIGGGKAFFVENLSTESILLKKETFCCISGEVAMETEPLLSDFLPKAVDFANKNITGSLAVTIIAKYSSKEDQHIIDNAICDLNYGSIGLNCNGLNTLFYPQLAWGGFHKNVDAAHLNSGIGFFGNCHGLRRPLKSVIRSPFIGINHAMQVIPEGREICRFQKIYERLAVGLCNRSSSYLFGLSDWIKIGLGGILGM